jgi:hypothetical protein
MVNIFLSLINFKQREVITVGVQRAKMYEAPFLPRPILGFGSKFVDLLSPARE